MIDATRKHIEKLTAEVAETPPQVSSVDVQNKKLAGLFTLSRDPGEGALYWTDTWMMVAIGLMITLASQFFNMLAWLPSTRKEGEETVAKPANDTSAIIPLRPRDDTDAILKRAQDAAAATRARLASLKQVAA
jgi:hypothetical protein